MGASVAATCDMKWSIHSAWRTERGAWSMELEAWSVAGRSGEWGVQHGDLDADRHRRTAIMRL